jgi:hypothetical protein
MASPNILTPDQIAEFRAKLEAKVAKLVTDAQENLEWFKTSTGAQLTRSDKGTIRVAVYSPLTGREVITDMFPIDAVVDRRFLETKVANIQPKVLGAFAEDYLHEQLLAQLRL